MSLDDPAKFVTCKDELSFCNVGPIDLRVCGTSHHRGFARTPEPRHPKVRSVALGMNYDNGSTLNCLSGKD